MQPATEWKAEAINFSDYLISQQKKVTDALDRWLRGNEARVVEAARYSLLSPSKRIRPLFCLETTRALGQSEEKAMPAALAVEMVHTYSLIHDDLPSMDDDDLRRGQATNHIRYDEATAILAGDGLLTSAFEVLSTAGDVSDATRVAWVKELSQSSGMEGMVLGQDLDMCSTETIENLEDLAQMHQKKTGALLGASVCLGGIAAGATASQLNELRTFGLSMGLAFQIRDDILDVESDSQIGKSSGSDKKNNKPTYVALLGLEKAKEQAQICYDKALKALSRVTLAEEHRLEELTRYVVKRDR